MKTYKVMIKESVKWEVIVTEKNYKEAIAKATNEVSTHEWGYFRMVGNVKYEHVNSCIARGEKENGN